MKKNWGKTEHKKAMENRAKLGSYTGNEKAWNEFLKKEAKHRRLHGKLKY